MVDQSAHDAICRELVDNGKLIEAGWVGFQFMAIPESAPDIQITEMRKAFFAGAQHLFASMMGMLEAGEDATDKDLRRMDQINAELTRFLAEFKAAQREKAN